MRVLLDKPPFSGPAKNRWERGWWPARWLAPENPAVLAPQVWAWRRRFTLDQAQRLRLHVSADERYELWLDGNRLGRGPERGDRRVWHFESHDLDLAAGEHLLTARTWWLGPDAPSPFAQVTLRPGFLCAAEGVPPALINTGHATWEVKRLDGYSWLPAAMTWATGVKVELDGAKFPWGWERGEGDGWRAPHPLVIAGNETESVDHDLRWWLRPAELPAMDERSRPAGHARHVEAIPDLNAGDLRVDPANHRVAEATAWNTMLTGGAAVVVPPRSHRRIILDLGDYACAYAEAEVSGGRGGELRCNWAESLFTAPRQEHGAKGQRDAIDGKWFWGTGDRFHPDGGAHRRFDGLWWQAGRFIELIVATADEPLTVHRLALRETGYPLVQRSGFACSEGGYDRVRPLLWRTLTACCHETFVDCPYYEQLQYVADSRVEALIAYAAAGDSRLARKAIATFDRSRLHTGLVESRAPHGLRQILSTFSLWWVGMVHDHAWWVGDLHFIRERMPTLRGILDHFLAHVGADGLLAAPMGWSFIDWCPEWRDGVPPDGEEGGRSAVLGWLLVWSLRQAAELEDLLGEPELSARWRRRAGELAAACDRAFWDEARGLYADAATRQTFSEHAQVLALLSRLAPPPRHQRLIAGLVDPVGLTRSTWYFSHYLSEALAAADRTDVLLARMAPWLELPDRGFVTIPERPEPSRSDCHAWSAHPLYHQLASVLGVRPATPGFATVRVRPRLGGLAWARGVVPHPRGDISVTLTGDGRSCHGEVVLPPGLSGVLDLDGTERAIGPGSSVF